MDEKSVVEQILELGRWAPSGDNNQYWRFERLEPMSVRVHGFDSRSDCVYDLDGHPSQISLGALLETIEIAASVHGLAVQVVRDAHAAETLPIFDLTFVASPGLKPSSLASVIEKRSVQRRPFSTRPLTANEKQALSDAAAPTHTVHWIEGFGQRLQAAKLMFHSAKLRLTIPEAYVVHKKIIQWNAQFSKDRIPDQALGASWGTLMMMRRVMESWERVHFFNRFLAGTWAPRIELDFIPGLMCAAHFALCAKSPPQDIDDYVAAGRAVQRFWLTATHLGLQLQPEVTPLIFARYAKNNVTFSTFPGTTQRAETVGRRLRDLLGTDVARNAVFLGRIGKGSSPKARSLRMNLQELTYDPGKRPR